ncbi:trypsin-like serine peptidase [Pseudomonas putida]|uniref:trypsin-like serine peptidase n=1 Tax=Pseudomonas putida TaxID=303 RepID=UPI003F3BCE1B
MKHLLTTFVTSAAFLFAEVGVCAPIRSPEQDEAKVLAYWTPENMKLAESASGGPANPVNEVLTKDGDHFGFIKVTQAHKDKLGRRAGVLFYVSTDGVPQHCSATALDSPKGDLVLTAAHCVVERGCNWKDMALFVPSYDGTAAESLRAPLGRWPVHYKYIPVEDAYSSVDSDLAIVSVFPQQGMSLKSKLGGASKPYISEVEEKLPNGEIWSYPGVNYSGGEMQRCVSRLEPIVNSTGISTPNCATMSGSSGSGFRIVEEDSDWVAGVVHGTGISSRLRESTFDGLYKLASGASEQASECSAP